MNYSNAAKWIRARIWIAMATSGVLWLTWLSGIVYNNGKDFKGKPPGVDHLAFYHAARLIYDGQSYKLYNYNELRDEGYQQKLLGRDADIFEAYRNPPFYALLYLPTCTLPYNASFVIWTVVGLALLVLALYMLRPESLLRSYLWSLTFYPVFAVVSFGQNTFISLAIFAGVYRLLANERRFAAGLIAGLLWFKPQLLLGLFIWWAFQPRRYFKCWLGVFVTGCVLATISFLAVPQGSRAFALTLQDNMRFNEFATYNVMNPKAFFALLLPGLPEAHWPLAACCSLAGIVTAWWLKKRTGAPVAVMFPTALFLSLWASPHALVYEWALVVAAAVVLWKEFPESRDAWLCVFALGWLALAVSVPLAHMQETAKLPVVLQIGVPLLGLCGWLVAKELARSKEAHARPTNEQPIATA